MEPKLDPLLKHLGHRLSFGFPEMTWMNAEALPDGKLLVYAGDSEPGEEIEEVKREVQCEDCGVDIDPSGVTGLEWS